MAKKKGRSTEKKIKKIKRTVKAVQVGSAFYTRVFPWILVGFAAASYALLGVVIPERKERTKYKETWR